MAHTTIESIFFGVAKNSNAQKASLVMLAPVCMWQSENRLIVIENGQENSELEHIQLDTFRDIDVFNLA